MKYRCAETLFCILLLVTPVHADCYSKSFSEIRQFADTVLSLELQTQQYMAKKLATTLEAASIRSESRLNGTNAAFEYDVDARTKSLNLSSDLSIWRRPQKIAIIEQRATLKEVEIFELENNEYTKKALAIISILASEKYIKIFEDRRELLNEQIKFYDQRINMGSGEFNKKLEFEQETLELSNKILSAKIKKQTQIIMNEINETQLHKFDAIGKVNAPPIKFVCSVIPKAIRSIDTQIQLLELQLNQAQKRFSPSLLGSVSSVWDENNLNEFSGKLVVNIPIYNGNKKNIDVIKLAQNLENLKRERIVSLLQLEKSALERNKIDEILMASLSSLEAQLLAKDEELAQIDLQQALGASVFEEKMQTKKEISFLEEARLSLITDLYTGWINFMSLRGDLVNDHP